MDRLVWAKLHQPRQRRQRGVHISKSYTRCDANCGHADFQRPAPPTAGSSRVLPTSQISLAYSLIARSEENQAMRAMLSILMRVQSNDDIHSLSMQRWVAV